MMSPPTEAPDNRRPEPVSYVVHLFWSLLSIDGNLLTHGSENDDVWNLLDWTKRRFRSWFQLTGVFSVVVEELLDFFSNLIVRALHVVLGSTIIRHEREEAIIGDINLLGFWSAQGHFPRQHPIKNSRAGIPDGEHWARPCYGWMGRVLQASFQ